MIRFYLILGLLLYYISLLAQPCTRAVNIDIPDNGNFYTSRIEVSTENSGNRILCGVRLSFSHQFVNELRFVLQSPSGKRLVLIAGKSGSSRTAGSSFDILFVRGDDTAHPDDFKKPVWQDNKWEQNTHYVGTYYPDGEAGLEHFDGERLTGTWNLIFADQVSGGNGHLESFQLIFCDNPDYCTPCSVPRDFISAQNFGSYCGGDPTLENLQPRFISENLTAGYEATFLVVNQRNQIVARGTNPDFSNLPKGMYDIFGLQYRAVHRDLVESTSNINTLNDLFYGIQSTLCGAISNNSAKITILSNPNYQNETIEVYGRDYYVIDGEIITSDQTISKSFTDQNGCDSLVNISVVFKNYTPTFSQDFQYNCDHTTIRLSVSTEQNFEIRRWFTRDGRISNQSRINSSEILVNSPGTYFVVFQIQDYLDTVSYQLVVDPASPVLALSNEYALCGSTSLTLQIGTNFTQATVSPSTSASINGNILTISQPNLYTVTVSNATCEITKNILVKPPEAAETVEIENATILCPGVPVRLMPMIESDYENYAWFRDGEQVASSRFISTDTPGLYTFRAFDNGQCGTSGTALVEDLSSEIDLRIEGPTLINCANQSLDNKLTASFHGDFSILWTLPDGTQSNNPSVSITGPGLYTVEISDGLGCRISESVTVSTDMTQVEIDVPEEVIIPCEESGILIKADLADNLDDIDIVWQGATATSSRADWAFATRAGIVSITARHVISQCIEQKMITVREEDGKPELNIDTDPLPITCDDPVRKIALGLDDCMGCEYNIFPEDIAIIGDSLIVDGPGNVSIELIKGECKREYNLQFPDQQKPRELIIDKRNIGCSETSGRIEIINHMYFSSIEFEDPSGSIIPYNIGTFHNIISPITYKVRYTDMMNGCTGTETIEITIADGVPTVTYEEETFLDCTTGKATLRLEGTGIDRVVWENPRNEEIPGSGNQIEVNEAGTYKFIVFNRVNCYREGSIEVKDDRSTPSVQLQDEYVVPCSSEDGLVQISYDATPLRSAAWYSAAGLISNDFHPNLGPGSYQVVLEGKNGCKATDETIVVPEQAGTGPDIIAPPITCNRAFSLVHLESYVDVAQVQWIDENGQSSELDTFEVYNPGNISLVIRQQNGCLISRSLTVEEDKFTVPFQINKPIINCHNLAPKMRVQVPDSIVRDIRYQWYLEDIPVGVESEYAIEYPGNYRVEVSFDNGCVDSARHTVELDTVPVVWELKTDTLTCARSKIQLSSDIRVNHIETVNWEGPGGFTSKALRPNFQNPGIYTVTYAGVNGCTAKAEMEIFDDQHAPTVDSVGFLSLGCYGKAVDLTYFTQDSVTTQYWQLPSGQILDESLVQIEAKGNYLLYLEGDNGCSKIDTFFIDKTVNPAFDLEVEAAGCDDQIGKARILPLLDTFETIWLEPGSMRELGRGHESPQLDVGSYLVTVINPYNQCDTTSVVDIVDISREMRLELSVDDSIRCERSQANLLARVYPPSDHYVYEWRYGTTGPPISKDTIAEGITQLGLYRFTARDTINQCVVDSTYRNVRAPSRLRNFRLFLTEPACDINRTGFAIMDTVFGASNMNLMTYSVNGSPFRDQDTFPFLYANEMYHIIAKDPYGCTIDTTLFPQLRGIMDRVSPIADTTIHSGDSINFNHPSFKIDYISADAPFTESYTWILNPDTLHCDADCAEPIQHQFFESRFITAVMTNEYGCQITDTFNIYVRQGDVLNVPNAIIPASNIASNAHACIYTNQYIENIELYIVFNRRGNVIFKQSNFSSQNPNQQFTYCWDGRDEQNNIHPPGNYNYYVKYRTIYGETKEKYGNILLIR